MDIKTVSVALVAVMVGAVMFGALFPIFDDVTATEDTFKNDGYYRMSKLTSSDADTVTIEWDYTTPNQVTVNNEDITLNANVTVSVISDTNFVFRALYTGGAFIAVQFYGATGGAFSATVQDAQNMTVVCSAGTATATVGENSKTASYDVIYYPDNDGAYIMKNKDESAYMLKDSEFFGCGTTTTVSSNSLGVVVDGTIEDGATVTVWRDLANGTVIDTDSVVVHSTLNNDYVGLYELDKITFDASYNSEDYAITYSYFVVPYEVTAERSVHVTDSMGAIMDLIPLIIGLGLVLMTVAFFLKKKL